MHVHRAPCVQAVHVVACSDLAFCLQGVVHVRTQAACSRYAAPGPLRLGSGATAYEPLYKPLEGRFRHGGSVSAGVRLAPEFACGGSKTREKGAPGPKPVCDGLWSGREGAGDRLVQSWERQAGTRAAEGHVGCQGRQKRSAALSERAPIPDRKQLIKPNFPGRAPRVALYITGSVRVQR